MCACVCACVRVCNFAINAVKSLCCIYLTFEYGQTNVITRTHHVGGPDEISRNACNAEHVVKGAFTNPPGPVRFSNPAACRRISRPCGALPNFISTAFMVTYSTEPGQCPIDI